MRRSRGLVRFVLAVWAGLVGSVGAGSARAQLLVASTPGDPPAIAHAELAYATGEGVPVTWVSLRLARGPVALVAALPDAAIAEPALDAWFAALETTASPNVVLPDDRAACGQAAGFVHVSWPRGAGAAATELSVTAAADVTAALDEQGVRLSGELPPADRYLVWSWAGADTEQTTRTLRVEGGAAPLPFMPGSSFPILVSAVTRGATAFPAEVAASDLTVTFVAGERNRTDYRDRLRDFLDGNSSPLLEMRARGPLFDWSIYSDSVSLAPLVSSYAKQAQMELPELDADACAEQLRALRKPDAPAATACGDARDVGLALAATGTELPTLQRFAVSATGGISPGDARPGGDPSSPVVRAKKLDDSACPPETLPPMVVTPPAQNGGSGAPAPSGNTTVVVEETAVVDDSHTEVNCGGSPQPEPRDGYYDDSSGCSSDTSSTSDSSDSSDSSCSGDSSSTSDSSDSSCSGDSSSTSDSNDSGCSSDTSSTSDSSSSSSDSGCDSGSTESGYNGDTCSGSAAPGAEQTEKARASLTPGGRARGPRRLKTSLWAVSLVALVLPIRRRKRGR